MAEASDTSTVAPKPTAPKPRNPYVAPGTKLPLLDVEWGEDRFLQVPFTSLIDLLYTEGTITITFPRYIITIVLTPTDKPFDLTKFRKDFHTGMVTALTNRTDLGFSIRVYRVEEEGPPTEL